MLTRCPHCGTTFRIAADQLKARQGRVRCGECHGVFDAVATLVTSELGEPTRETTPSAPAAAAEPLPAAPLAPTEAALSPEAGAEPAVSEPPPEAEAPALPEPVPAAAPAEPTPNAEAEPKPSPVVAPEPQLHEEEPPPRALRWPWVLASLLALLALLAQALFHFRTELAVLAPETRPLFAGACEALGCEIALPRKIELIGIETSDLAPAKGKAGLLNLTATLRNRAPFAQTWPYLEVTLTDAQDRALLRRALAPVEYLPAEQSVAAGLPGQSEQAVQLTLDVGDTPAVGYRLYIFHP